MTDRQYTEGIQVTDLERGDAQGVTQVIIQPGVEAPAIGNAKTVRLHVQDGSVRLWISDGAGDVQVKGGAAIRSDDGAVFCETGKRGLSLDAPVVLTAGNSCFVEDGVLHLAVVGQKPAELHIAAQERGDSQTAAPDRLAVPQRTELGVGALAQTMQYTPADASDTSSDVASDEDTSDGAVSGGKPGGIQITPYACWVCPGRTK
jgi:hypothetical protein